MTGLAVLWGLGLCFPHLSGEPRILLDVGQSMRHATEPGEARILHQESLTENDHLIRVVQQHPSTAVTLASGEPDAFEHIVIEHRGTNRYQDWIEFDQPGILPASGSDGPLVIEFRARVQVTDTTRGIQHHIGLSARNSASYAQDIIDADVVRTPNTITPGNDDAQWRIYRFEIFPAEARVEARIDEQPVGSFQLSGSQAERIRTANLGFTRLYFRSIQPGKATDGALMDGIQTFTVDWIRIEAPAGPAPRPFKSRELFAMSNRIFNASSIGSDKVESGEIIRQGWSELVASGDMTGATLTLENPLAGFHREISLTLTMGSSGRSALRMRYPYVLQTATIRGRLLADARIAVTATEDATGSNWSIGVRARSDLNGGIILSPTDLKLPPQPTGITKSWQDVEFEYSPDRDDLILRLDGKVVTSWTPPAETIRLLQEGNLLDFEWVLIATPTSGSPDGPLGGKLRFHFDQIRAQLGYTLVTAEEVMQHFAATHPHRQHPRTLFTAVDIERIQSLIDAGDPVAVRSFERLIAEADDLSRKDGEGNYLQPIRQWELDEGNLRVFHIHRFSGEVGVLGLAWQLTGHEPYAARLWAQIDAMNSYPDWGHNRHFLDTGVAMANYAIALDLIRDYLSPAQRTAMLTALKSKGLQPTVNGMRGNTWWSRDPNNWNSIIHGGAILAGLAFFEDDPELMAEAVALAANGLTHYIDAFYPDGQTEEGFLYWGYGLMYGTRALEALSLGLGTDFGLSDSIGIRNTRNFPLFMTGPVATINVGDDGIQSSKVSPNWWLARRFDDANQMYMLRERWMAGNGTEWLNLAWYDPALVGDGATGLESLDNYLRGMEVVSHTQSWDDPDALYIAAHGGDNAASHGHLDAGSFYLQGAGHILAYGNLGPDNYNSPGFFNNDTRPGYLATSGITTQQNAGRWHFYNLRTEGKNALVFKPRGVPGDIRPEQDPQGLAIVDQQFSSPRRGYSILNLSSVYRRDVPSYRRGVMLSANRTVATVQDEFITREDKTVWWSMHHGSNVVILDDNGRAARLFVGGQPRFRARIVEPAEARFTEMRQLTYLAGENAYPMTRNDQIPRNIRKLMIEMDVDAGTPTTLAVQFTVEPEFSATAALQPLDDWHLDRHDHIQLGYLEFIGMHWALWMPDRTTPQGYFHADQAKDSGWLYHHVQGWIYPYHGQWQDHLFAYSVRHGWISISATYRNQFFRHRDDTFIDWY